jgi:hypothetical protein
LDFELGTVRSRSGVGSESVGFRYMKRPSPIGEG